MFSPFFKKPKIYNQILEEYITKTNNDYLRKLSDVYENNKKLSLNSTINKFHNLKNDTNINNLNSNQFVTSISFIFFASTFMIYLYNLRK
jgi:hypothetical protein